MASNTGLLIENSQSIQVRQRWFLSPGDINLKVWQELIRRGDSKRELFYDHIAHVFQNSKKNLLRLTNYTIARQVLHIKSWIYESATKCLPCSYRTFMPWAGLLAILAKSIAIPITIFCGKSIAIAIAIQLLKKYCNTNTYTPSNTNKQSILSGEVRCSLL